MPSRILSIGNQVFKASPVHVLFKGERSGEQVIRVQDKVVLLTEETTLGSVAQQASLLRFRKEMDLSAASFTIAAAATLMPETGKEMTDTVILKEEEADSPQHELWLHVALDITILSQMRAWAADVMYRAMKTEAAMNNIVFSDTVFAKIALDKKCCALSKALGHSLTERTPADGKLVMMLESKVEAYRADFGLLQADLAAYRNHHQAARDQMQAAVDEAAHHRFGHLATIFLNTYLPAYTAARNDRHHRVRIIQSILQNAQTEENLDSSWWTARKVEVKLKKMLPRLR